MSIVTEQGATLESQAEYNIAIEKINRNNFDSALGHLTAALQIAPTNPNYLSHFGLCLAHTRSDFPRAIKACKQAIRTKPIDPVLWVNLGKVYRLQGANGLAHEQFLRAFELNKKHPTTASELIRMGVRRPPFFSFLSRGHWANRYFGLLRAHLERKIVGHRQS